MNEAVAITITYLARVDHEVAAGSVQSGILHHGRKSGTATHSTLQTKQPILSYYVEHATEKVAGPNCPSSLVMQLQQGTNVKLHIPGVADGCPVEDEPEEGDGDGDDPVGALHRRAEARALLLLLVADGVAVFHCGHFILCLHLLSVSLSLI